MICSKSTSSQAKCPILAYSNLPLGVIHVLSETSNQHALSFASTNEIVEEFGNFEKIRTRKILLPSCGFELTTFGLEAKRSNRLSKPGSYLTTGLFILYHQIWKTSDRWHCTRSVLRQGEDTSKRESEPWLAKMETTCQAMTICYQGSKQIVLQSDGLQEV